MPPMEIERKFLVDLTKLRFSDYPNVLLTQGYITFDPAVRVRYQGSPEMPEKAWLTFKGSGLLSREEHEFELSGEDVKKAVALLTSMRAPETGLIRKRRYSVTVNGTEWTVDEFLGPSHLDGLWMAEIELTSEDEKFDIPAWATREVTQDKRFSNTSLLKRWPFES